MARHSQPKPTECEHTYPLRLPNEEWNDLLAVSDKHQMDVRTTIRRLLKIGMMVECADKITLHEGDKTTDLLTYPLKLSNEEWNDLIDMSDKREMDVRMTISRLLKIGMMVEDADKITIHKDGKETDAIVIL